MNRKQIPLALQPDLKFRYECTDESVESLAKCAGMAPQTFRQRAKELGWKAQNVDRRGRRQMVMARDYEPPVITEQQFEEARLKLPIDGEPADDIALARRIRRAVEHELAAIEIARKDIAPAQRTQTESITRILAGLTRALQEARRIEDTAVSPTAKDHDDFPREFSELRRALAARLDALVAEQEEEDAGKSG